MDNRDHKTSFIALLYGALKTAAIAYLALHLIGRLLERRWGAFMIPTVLGFAGAITIIPGCLWLVSEPHYDYFVFENFSWLIGGCAVLAAIYAHAIMYHEEQKHKKWRIELDREIKEKIEAEKKAKKAAARRLKKAGTIHLLTAMLFAAVQGHALLDIRLCPMTKRAFFKSRTNNDKNISNCDIDKRRRESATLQMFAKVQCQVGESSLRVSGRNALV